MATIDAVAEIDGDRIPVRVDIHLEQQGSARMTLDHEWLEQARLSPDRIDRLQKWVAEVRDADPLADEGRMARNPAFLRQFLAAQGYREAMALDDGTLIVHRADETNPDREYLAFRSRNDLDVVHKQVPAVRVYDELDARGSSLVDFASIDRPTQPLRTFLAAEGLDTREQADEEVAAWTRCYHSRAALPALRGIRARLASGGITAPTKEVELAELFDKRLRAQGYEPDAYTQDSATLPIYRRVDQNQGTHNSLVWRTGDDGMPRYRDTTGPLNSIATTFRASGFQAPEKDFATFLRQEGLSLNELPAGYGLPLSLPLEGNTHAHERSRPNRHPLEGRETKTTSRTAGDPLLHDEPAPSFPIDAFLRAQGYQPYVDAFKFIDGTRVYAGQDSLRTLVVQHNPAGPTAYKDLDPVPYSFLQGPDGPNQSLEFKAVPGPERSIGELLAEDHPTLSRQQIAQEMDVWTTWQSADGGALPPLRGIRERDLFSRVGGAVDELAAARAFAAAVADAGFHADGVHAGLPMLTRRAEDGHAIEHVVWRIAEDGQPVWKPLASYLDLDIWGAYEELPGPERGMDDFVHRRDPPGPDLGPVGPESPSRDGGPPTSARPSRATEEESRTAHDDLDDAWPRPQQAQQDDVAFPAPNVDTANAGPDHEAQLRALARHVQQIPLLAAHGFQIIATLEDGSRIFNRRPEIASRDLESAPASRTIHGDYLAIAQHQATADLSCKLLTHAEAATLTTPPVTLAFAAIKDLEQPLHGYLARDGLLEPAELAAELRIYAEGYDALPGRERRSAEEASFLTRVQAARAALNLTIPAAAAGAPSGVSPPPSTVPVMPFMQAQGFIHVATLADQSRVFVRMDDPSASPGNLSQNASAGEYIAVREDANGQVLFKRLVTDIDVITHEADVIAPTLRNTSFADIEGTARPLSQFVIEESGYSLIGAAAAKELATWSLWEQHHVDAPLRGIRQRAAQGGLSAQDEIAYAVAFASSLRDRGFEPYSGTDDYLPIWRRIDEGPDRRIAWHLDATGEPAWKWADSAAESVTYDELSPDHTERSWRELPRREIDLEPVPGSIPAEDLDASRIEPSPAAFELYTHYEGTTSEGLSCEYTIVHDADAPDGSLPLRIRGSFQSRDGGGDFAIDRVGDEYVDYDGNRHRNPDDLLPWVVGEGTMRPVRQKRVPVHEIEIDIFPDRPAGALVSADHARSDAAEHQPSSTKARVIYHATAKSLAERIAIITGANARGASPASVYNHSDTVDQEQFLRHPREAELYHLTIARGGTDAPAPSQARTRALLTQMEQDLGRPLIWLASDSRDERDPHTHILIRSVDAEGKDLGLERYLRGLEAKVKSLDLRSHGNGDNPVAHLAAQLIDLPDGRSVPWGATQDPDSIRLFDRGVATEFALSSGQLVQTASVTTDGPPVAHGLAARPPGERTNAPLSTGHSPPAELVARTAEATEIDQGSVGEVHGAAAAVTRLADARHDQAQAATPVDPTATVAYSGMITWGPESTVTVSGQRISRAVIWSDPPQTPGLQVVVFPPHLADVVADLRAGDYITVSGLPRQEEARMPWHAWATSVTLPNHDEPTVRVLVDPPLSDALFRSTFGVPHMHRHSPLIPGPRRFDEAAKEPAVHVSTEFDEVRLTRAIHEYAQERRLSAHAEDLVRFAFLSSGGSLPATVAADVQAWAADHKLERGFIAETPSEALNRQFTELPRIDPKPFEEVGISPATLQARPFRSVLRADEHGCVAISTSDLAAVALVRTSFATPGRFETVSGRGPGMWLSAANRDGSCSRIVVTQSPVTAMAFHQQNPSDDAQYVAVGGDRLTDDQRPSLQKLLADITRANGGRKPEVVVTAHHGTAGLKLFSQVQRGCPDFDVKGVVPKHDLGRDWVDAARNDREPERRLDLPAYAASRLGYEEIYRSADHQKVMMTLPSSNVSRDSAYQDWLASGPKPLPDGTWVLQGRAPTDERLLFIRQPDGSWKYENDRTQAGDRGGPADFARAKLQLSLEDLRSDVRRFSLEQDLKKYQAIAPDSQTLGQRGIYPDTASSPCFRGTLRTDTSGRLVYVHQDARGMCGIEKTPLQNDSGRHGHERTGAKGLWISNPNPDGRMVTKIVVVDTPLAALAYHQLNPAKHVRYVASLGTALTADQKAVLRVILDRAAKANHGGKLELVVATSRDRAGQDFANTIMRACPDHAVRRHTPALGQNWLDSVQRRERNFIQALAGPSRKTPSLAHGI